MCVHAWMHILCLTVLNVFSEEFLQVTGAVELRLELRHRLRQTNQQRMFTEFLELMYVKVIRKK